MPRFVLAAVLALFSVPPALAGPRDELLRVAPSDAAIIVIIQNARDHYHAAGSRRSRDGSPRPPSARSCSNRPSLAQLRDSAAMIFRELDATPETADR